MQLKRIKPGERDLDGSDLTSTRMPLWMMRKLKVKYFLCCPFHQYSKIDSILFLWRIIWIYFGLNILCVRYIMFAIVVADVYDWNSSQVQMFLTYLILCTGFSRLSFLDHAPIFVR